MAKEMKSNKQLKKALDPKMFSEEEQVEISKFGYRLRSLRESLNMTQQDLGLRIRVSGASVNKYESDDGVFPSVPTLLMITRFFNVSTDYLLMGVDHEPSSVSNTINSDEMNNSSVVQMGSSNQVSVSRGMSAEAEVLLKNFESLNFEKKMKVLTYALTLKDSQGEVTP